MQQGTSRTTYTYDDNGNLANEDSVGVNDMNSYDRENRLISQERNEITFLSYTYDGYGLRRKLLAIHTAPNGELCAQE